MPCNIYTHSLSVTTACAERHGQRSHDGRCCSDLKTKIDAREDAVAAYLYARGTLHSVYVVAKLSKDRLFRGCVGS